MRRATLKSLLAHKLRLALTATSVILGVAFIAGTLILTDTLNATFDQLFGEANKGTAVAVRATNAFGSSINGEADRAPVPAALLPLVRAVPGVSSAVGNVSGYAQLVDPRTGKPVGTGGAPSLGVDWSGVSELSPLHLIRGVGPAAPGEIAIDRATADDHHLRVGQQVRVLLTGPPEQVRIAGVFTFGTSSSLAGASLTAFAPAVAQQLLGTPGTFTDISLSARPGISQEALRGRVATVLPHGYEAVTGKKVADESSSAIKTGLSFFTIFLLVFAVIALFVGSFIIFNTFTMLVAQRTRELALLRAVGASRGQVTRSVLVEAVIVGLVGATLGLLIGVALAFGLKALLSAFGITLPSHPLVFRGRTVVAAYLVGVLVTTVAAYSPARRAAKIPPVAALRDDVALPQRSLRRRAIVGTLVTAAGAAFMAAGLAGAGSQPAALVGIGAAAVFLGVAALSPFISGPVIRVIGAPLPRLFRLPGRLSRENALRNPRRTAATAAALMIGIALVSAMTVLSSSLKASVDHVIDASIGADYVITAGNNSQGFSNALAGELRRVPGVDAVTPFRFGLAAVGPGASPDQILAADPATVGRSLTLTMKAGSLAALARGDLLVSQKQADAKHWRVDQTIPVKFARTGTHQLRIGGIYKPNQVAGTYLISTGTYDRNFTNRLDALIGVSQAGGTSAKTVQSRLAAVVKSIAPNASVKSQTQFKADQRAQINSLLGLVTALLGLALFIAVLGIVNTLALSVLERTREIGLLRAVGMSRRQLRRAIRLEAVLISVFGALLGLVVGVAFGWALVTALNGQGIDRLRIPVGSLAVYVVVAGVVGILAALLPARRAARMDVLQAVAST